MRAALVANREDVDPGLVGRALRRHGYTFTEFLREDHEEWLPMADFDLVLALGSNWSTYWDHVADPVRAEQKLLREAMQRDIPIFGICFGAQQVAAVLGAEITKAQSPEIGWCQVFATSEARSETPVALTSGPLDAVALRPIFGPVGGNRSGRFTHWPTGHGGGAHIGCPVSPRGHGDHRFSLVEWYRRRGTRCCWYLESCVALRDEVSCGRGREALQ